MSAPITHPETDVVVLGLGQTGGPIAAELTAAGHSVVGIEKGPFWDYNVDWIPTNIHDEWAIMMERKFDHPLYISTFTIRNNSNQFALPMRRYTKQIQYHALGHGVGGASTHYGGALGRFSPWSYQPVTMTVAKYGQDGYNQIISNVKGGTPDIEDWPVTYEEMVPYYQQWEKAIGVSGDTQEPFLPYSKYVTPPHPATPYGNVYRDAASSLGYHPFPQVSGLVNGTYTNQYGINRNACIYCGWCAGFCNYACEVGAKSSSHVTTIPAALNANNLFTMQLQSYAFRIDTDSSTGKATGVRYYDSLGQVHVQPAKVVFNGLWGFNLIRIMLLSGMGVPYNVTNHTGSLGRGLANGYYPSTSNASVQINMSANTYSCGNGSGGGYQVLDLSEVNPNWKHPLTFLGGASLVYGGYLGSSPGTFSAKLPSRTALGSDWKSTLVNEKIPSKLMATLNPNGPNLPLLENYADLDPHYNDIYGDPCARITLDWDANTYRVANYLVHDDNAVTALLGKMGDPSTIKKTNVPELSQHVDWWGHHMRGGARTGKDKATSVFNKWMQCWTSENLFAAGEICDTFGDNLTAGTHVAGAMAYLAADGIKRYLSNPAPLVTG